MWCKFPHYIPKEILRGFKRENVKNGIWEYCFNTHKYENKNINNVCKIKYLYEWLDSQNKIMYRNYMENRLGKCETMFKDVLNKIDRLMPLSDDDLFLCVVMMHLQLLRTPVSINKTLEDLMNEYKGVHKNSLRNSAILNNLELNSGSDCDTVIRRILHTYKNFVIEIWYTLSSEFIISNYMPVSAADIIYEDRRCGCTIFPISYKCCIVLFDNDNDDKVNDDLYINIDDETVGNINRHIIYLAKQGVNNKYFIDKNGSCFDSCVYSKHKLNLEELT